MIRVDGDGKIQGDMDTSWKTDTRVRMVVKTCVTSNVPPKPSG